MWILYQIKVGERSVKAKSNENEEMKQIDDYLDCIESCRKTLSSKDLDVAAEHKFEVSSNE